MADLKLRGGEVFCSVCSLVLLAGCILCSFVSYLCSSIKKKKKWRPRSLTCVKLAC